MVRKIKKKMGSRVGRIVLALAAVLIVAGAMVYSMLPASGTAITNNTQRRLGIAMGSQASATAICDAIDIAADVTAGTATASKALVLDASSNIDTVVATGGFQVTSTARTATSGGLTTGIISANTGFVTITSANANNIVTLPAPVAGMVIRCMVNANGCEVRTVAESGVKINDIDSDGTNEAAIPSDTHFIVECISSTEWILRAFTKLGVDVAAIVPDAAA